MNLFRHLFCSSLGKKYIMAGSGAMMFLFVIGHWRATCRSSSARRRSTATAIFSNPTSRLLWPVRIVLLAHHSASHLVGHDD